MPYVHQAKWLVLSVGGLLTLNQYIFTESLDTKQGFILYSMKWWQLFSYVERVRYLLWLLAS